MSTKKSILYQYAILWHPNEAEAKEGRKSEVIVQPDTILATDQNSAFINASRKIPEKYLSDLDQIDILIRPF